MRKDLEKYKQERLGEVNISNEGYKMKIIEYNNANDIIIEFQDEYKARVHTQYSVFQIGNVKNPFYKSVYDIGYLGQGKYKTKINGKQTKAYIVWKNMLKRCYDPYAINEDKNLVYKDCFICNEWYNFQNFAKWFYKNYYEISNEKMCLDKDILIKGNKIYSPETCIFVPNRINTLFIKQNKNRGEYPIGITYHKRDKILEVSCYTLDKNVYLGRFPLNRPFQAFTVYKTFKESYIKQVADEYKDLIPAKLYEAMYRYEVEIND